jgi:hypothetical protein
MEDNRKNDSKKERFVAEFLDKHFYNQDFCSNFERVTDKERQIQGLDTVVCIKDKTYYIDEKASTDYISKPLTTFILELTFINRNNEEYKGWFLDETKTNSHYLFVWFNKVENNELISADSIKDIDIAIVSKQKIKDYLLSIGWNDYNLGKKAHNIRYNNDKNFGVISSNGCKFSYSVNNKREKPINVILSKDKYKELADVFQNIKVK